MSGSAPHDDDTLAARVAGLDAARRRLLARRLAALGNVGGSAAEDGPRRGESLVAHVVARAGHAPSVESLREHLAARLPAHMVPQRFVIVEALPRTAAGKLDRRALSPATTAPEPAAPPSPSAAGDEAEQLLRDIWKEVLGLPEVGLDEDFFELGGDSLLSIRILSRAGQAGLRISPEAFFANPTIAGQARAAGEQAGAPVERGPVTGTLPLTPIQHWFFERIPLQQQHWNQCFSFELLRPTSLATLERALAAVLVHHDALRQRFDAAPRTAEIVAPGTDVPLVAVDLRRETDETLEAAVESAATEMNASLDLSRPPLLRMALVRTRDGLADRLLLAAHHLLVDGLSWRILLEDLEQACLADERGQPLRLPAKTTSYRRWSQRLVEHAQEPALRAELGYWREVCAQPFALPLDRAAGADHNLVRSARTHGLVLDADTTAAVLRALPSARRTGVRELLLAALAVALRNWLGATTLRLDLEGHGRESLFADVDVSRTVGWFTSVYPLALDLSAAHDAPAALAEVAQRLRALPGAGIGHGLLRELCEAPAVRAALEAPPSWLLFNYLGTTARSSDRLAPLGDAVGTPRAPQAPRAYVLEINAYVADDRLRVDWSYSAALHEDDTIAGLARDFEGALVALVQGVAAGETEAPRPEDFPLAGLDSEDLEGLAQLLDQVDAGDVPGDEPR